MLASYINGFPKRWLLPAAACICVCACAVYWLTGGGNSAGSDAGQTLADRAAYPATATQKMLPDTLPPQHSDFSSAGKGWISRAEIPAGGTARNASAGHETGSFENPVTNPVTEHYSETPVLSVTDSGAVEVAIPVAYSGGAERHATVPVALALAADPRGLPQSMRAAVQGMANDFLDDIAPAAGGSDPSSAAYFSRWQAAARKSDQEFKMRYGKVAFVQMNLLTAQEAAASAR